MVLVDTCGWIEWLTNGIQCDKYQPYFEKVESIFVPTSVQFELYKWVSKNHGTQSALEVIALTEQATVTSLSTSIALSAADFSMKYGLSFADAIIYASAHFYKATLITSDSHFKDLPGVVFFEKTT